MRDPEGASALNDNSKEEIRTYDLIVRIAKQLEQLGMEDFSIKVQVATAIFNKGATLKALNRTEDAIGIYDELVRRFADATEPELREPVASGLFSKAFMLNVLNRNDDAIGVYDELVRRFGDATEPELREHVAKG